MVEWDAASWFTRGRFICLLEVFILKKGNEKNGYRQANIKKTNTHLQNVNKIIIIIIIIIIIKHRQRRQLRVYDTHKSTLDLTQAGWLLPLLKSLRCHCSEFKTKKKHTHTHTQNWSTMVIDAFYIWEGVTFSVSPRAHETNARKSTPGIHLHKSR